MGTRSFVTTELSLTEFPELGRTDLRNLKKGIDEAFKGFTRNYGEGIEDLFIPLLRFLVWFEKLMLATPWPLMIVILCALVYAGARNWVLVVGTATVLLVAGYLGMWEDMMKRLS
ncbi:MAG: proline/glycine betaine ABC transporter permease, partial [Paracoccaceae bacterium]